MRRESGAVRLTGQEKRALIPHSERIKGVGAEQRTDSESRNSDNSKAENGDRNTKAAQRNKLYSLRARAFVDFNWLSSQFRWNLSF